MNKPSPNKLKKIERANLLSTDYEDASWLFLFQYKGLNAFDNSTLRGRLKKAGGKMVVVKNKINSLVLQKSAKFNCFSSVLTGQVATVMTNEPVEVAKVLNDFVKHKKIDFLGYSEGSAVNNQDSLKRLASLPSINILRGQLLGTLSSPAASLLRLIGEPHAGLVRVLDSYSRKDS